MRPLPLMSSVLLAACSAGVPTEGWLADADVVGTFAADAVRVRSARVDTPFVEGAFTPAAFVTPRERSLPLFEDLNLDVVMDDVMVTTDQTTWTGHLHGWPDHEVIWTRSRSGMVSGFARTPEALVRIRPHAPNVVLIEEVAVRIGDVDPEPLIPHDLPALDVPAFDGESSSPIIDVLVAASDPVVDDLGGSAGLATSAAALIAQANKGYADSGISARLRLAGTHSSPWDETGFDWATDLARLATDEDGVMDDVIDARDAAGADVVAMLVDGDGGACGLGYLMSPARPAFARAAYSMTDAGCAASNLSFAHEIGHNLGLHHDRDHAVGTPATDTAYGYQDPDGDFRTVMAYDCSGRGCPRLNLWSSPDVLVDSVPAGVAASSSRSAHNVLALSLTGSVVEAFRDPPEEEEEEEEAVYEAASILAPTAGTTLAGATVAVVWEDVEALSHTLTIGSSQGGADLANLEIEGTHYAVVAGLPTDGRSLYVTLWSDHGDALLSTETTWTAARPPAQMATLTSPSAGSLSDTTARFAWQDVGADSYALVLGSSRFGSDLGTFSTVATELEVSGLPDDGRQLWATLHTRTGDAWRSSTHTFQAFDADPGAFAPASMLEPAEGATLRSRNLTFRWSDAGATAYAITVWSGSTEVYHATTTATSESLSLSPSVDSGPLTVRLATQHNGQWFSRETRYVLD